MRRKRSMTQVYLTSMLLLTIVPIVLIGAGWALMRYHQFEQDVQKQRETYLSTNKQFLRDQVAEIIAFISHEDKLAQRRLRERLRQHAEQAYLQVAAFYQALPAPQRARRGAVLAQLISLFRPVRFSDGRGWFVLLEPDGKLLLNPAFPELENHNVFDIEGLELDRGKRDIAALLAEDGEGYLQLAVTRKDDPQTRSQRLFYIRFFKPLNLVILSGEYIGDVQSALQRELLTVISETRFYPQRSEPFIISGEGEVLAQPARPARVGVNASALTDLDTGASLLQQYRAVAGQPSGGFVEFVGRRQQAAEPVHGVNFVQAYAPWNWLVGSGLYLDKLEAQIAAEREVMRASVAREIGYVTLGLALAVALVIAIASWFARKTASGFSRFNRFFEGASHSLSEIDKDRLPYAEFYQLAEDANWMIEERSRYERALKNSEKRFKLALKYSHHFMWDIDVKTGELSISEGFFESLGYEQRDLDFHRFETILDICHPDDLASLQSDLRVQRMYKTGIEFRLREKTGGYRWFFGRGSRMEAQGNKSGKNRLLGIVADISDRKQIEQDLIQARIKAEQASEAKSQFLAAMSHELRTPLNGVMGYAQLLLRQTVLTGEQRESLHAIIDCGEHLLDLIGELLQLAQTEARELDVVSAPLKVSDLIEDISEQCAAKAERHGLEFSARVERGVPADIISDAGKLKQILVNMVANGIKFTQQGWVRLKVELDASARCLNFVVSDSGVGIEPEDLPAIFEPFRQLQGEDTDGAGLGLALSRRLAVSLGGELVASSVVGKGSEFILRIPLRTVSGDSVVSLENTLSYQSKKTPQQVKLGAGTVSNDKVAALRQALDVGDVESLQSLLRRMLAQSNNRELNRWLQQLLDSLEHFDMESVQQMIEQA